jgi:hypothetical protein
MTFEGTQCRGASEIVGKLHSIGKVTHTVKTMDVQPNDTNAIIIFVTGAVQIGGGAGAAADANNPLHFSEMFLLVATNPGQYYVQSNVFRLNYGL